MENHSRHWKTDLRTRGGVEGDHRTGTQEERKCIYSGNCRGYHCQLVSIFAKEGPDTSFQHFHSGALYLQRREQAELW